MNGDCDGIDFCAIVLGCELVRERSSADDERRY